MTLRDEDRELQIKLAELQADIQIYLTACFGFLAGFLAILIGFEQIYFTLSPEEILSKIYLAISIPLVGIVCFVTAIFFARKAFRARKQMEELRKKYVW